MKDEDAPLPVMFVFHEGVLHSKRNTFPRANLLHKEVYNHGFVLVVRNRMPKKLWYPSGWYRPDGTPYPTEQVPPELRTLALLLT
jgi:hypothetical protein